jgi:CRP-like cAMP-binding protein
VKLERPEGEVHDAIRERLAAGPDFWLDLLADLEHPVEELHVALWDLAWAGEVTNDAFSPLRAPRLRAAPPAEQRGRRFARRRAAGAAVQGRWSLTAPLFENAPAAGPRLRAQAELMLERYGIVTRETVLAEGVPGGFASLYAELGNLELLGTARRGYFVEGLGGAQFALPGAVERLRSLPFEDGSFLLLAATDPANPYGASLPWPKPSSGRRPARAPGAHVLMRDGAPVVYVERGGRGIVRLVELGDEELADQRARRSRRRGPPAKAGDRETRRRADNRLRPGGRPARRRLQPWPPQAHPRRPLSVKGDNRRMEDREVGQGPVALLRSVPLFADLEEGELERFSRVAVARSFPAATRVFHEGDRSDACYIVRDGNFRVTREHSDGRAITLATLGHGDIFGELAMLDGEVRSASVEALTDGELLALPAGEVRALLARHPEITVKLIAALVRRLRSANERISRQSFQTVPSRVAGVLSQLVAEESPRGIEGGEVTIRMNQADLAQLAGTSRESVSRFLADLERAGVVRPGRGRVTVLAPEKLSNYIF